MDLDDVQLHNRKTKKQRRCRCIVAILVLVVLFVIGIVIGYFIGKTHKSDSDEKEHQAANSEAMRKENQKQLRDAMDAEEMEQTARLFSKRPHIAGSERQKELAEELVKRWRREYGFNKVDMREYKVLLSFPQKDKRNVVSLRYQNGTIAFQTTGKAKIAEQSENDTDVVPPFLGYSPSGTVEGDLVYVNYGRLEDFELLTKKLNVTVAGKIVIVRYGKIFRGSKVKNAATYGAVGAIIYSDPQARAPLGPENTFPKTPFLPPTGVQRGSIYTRHGLGDPLTPGRPAIPGVYRIPINDSELPSIPAHPMSYGDAVHFLSKLQGDVVPDDWKGDLNITYRLGPGFSQGMKIRLEIHNNYTVSSIYNVIGTIYGKEEPDRYVMMGNHRDAWIFGGVDAVSGTTATTEVARGLGVLLKKGWRPRRSVIMCSWGAEEYALIGSVEYVEEHAKDLALKAITYINIDSSVSGNWVMRISGSPLFKDIVTSVEKTVADPNAHDDKQTLYDIMAERNPTPDNKAKYGDIGSGSDFAHFYHYVGVPVMDFGYFFGFNNATTFGYPVYHTQHDTHYWMTKFIDPKFLFHKAIAQFGGTVLLEVADAPLLPLNLVEYTTKLNSSWYSLKDNQDLKKQKISLEHLEEAINGFMKAANEFGKRLNEARKKVDEMSYAELRRMNDQIIQVEKSFIYSDGLYGRKLVKHVIFAPEMHNAYAASSLPGINDAIFDARNNGKWFEVEKQISIVIECLHAATEAIQPFGN